MPSTHFSRLLIDHLDGDLDGDGREALAREIENDGEAARQFDDALHMEALLTAAHLDGAAAPVSSQRRQSTARPGSRPHPRRPLRLRTSHWHEWVAAAVLLIVAGGVALWIVASGKTALATTIVQGPVLIDDQPATAIRDGVPFTVGDDRPASIKLADGSRVNFEPASQATIRGSSGDARQTVELTAGSGEFHVEHADTASPFKVRTSLGEITVLGTNFTVTLSPPADPAPSVLSVAVISGRVNVERNGRHYLLTAAEHPLYSSDEEPPLARNGDEKPKDPVIAGDSRTREHLAIADERPKILADEHAKEPPKELKLKEKFADDRLFKGIIKSIDVATGSVTILAAVTEHDHESMVIPVNAHTRIRLNEAEAKLSDLRPDDFVEGRCPREPGSAARGMFVHRGPRHPVGDGELHKPHLHPGDGKPETDAPAGK